NKYRCRDPDFHGAKEHTIHPVRGYSAFFHTIVTQTAKKVPFRPESNCPESCRRRSAHWDSESSFSD
ncbi:MAG: hypothetical protein U0M82_15005, partial [Bilophila wadsworthia]